MATEPQILIADESRAGLSQVEGGRDRRAADQGSTERGVTIILIASTSCAP